MMGDNVEEPKERAAFYRDLLVKLMGFGMAVVVVICLAMMAAGETEVFSLEDPNQVAMDAAKPKGEPNSNEYKAEFDKVLDVACERQDRAMVYICIIWVGTICWLVAIGFVWVFYRRLCGKKPAMRGGWVIAYCALLFLAQLVLSYSLLDIDEHGWRKFLGLLIEAFRKAFLGT